MRVHAIVRRPRDGTPRGRWPERPSCSCASRRRPTRWSPAATASGALGTTFVVNDDVDAALELGADGVHLGQSDRGAAPRPPAGLLLGRSATSYEQAVAADADYLGVGPIWETPSKHDADPPLGLDELARICAAVSVPVIAIGGIDAVERRRVHRAGAAGVAVIRAATDPALRRAVDEALARSVSSACWPSSSGAG